MKWEQEKNQNLTFTDLFAKNWAGRGLGQEVLQREDLVTNHLSLRIIHDAVHRIQQSHLLVQLLNCLFVQLESIKYQH